MSAGLTISGDSTTIRHIDYVSRNIYVTNGDAHTRHSLGVHSAPNHTSEGQMKGWEALTEEVFATYNASPRGKANPADPRSFYLKTCGVMSDHAEDQKKFARLFEERKRVVDREVRGERAFATVLSDTLVLLLAEETMRAMEVVGGHDIWNSYDASELDKCHGEILHAVKIRLGEDAYQALSVAEKAEADLFIRGGCCMHKDLNMVKGGNTRMGAGWDKKGVTGPCTLPNRDLAVAASSSDPKTRERAAARLVGGAIKLLELIGMILNNKDDKKGQHDTWRYYAEAKFGRVRTFPDTSNVRFGSYVEAAAELITHLEVYIEFLNLVRHKKESRSFSHIEQNVYIGLHDPPTLIELCAIAIYGQAVSHPYMRQARRGCMMNHLDLGPLHDNLEAHIKYLIERPDVLLATPNPSYETGTLDGEPWEHPDLFPAIHTLTHIITLSDVSGAFVDFCEGALDTLPRFVEEFSPSGPISKLTDDQKRRAWMKPTNDDNEGALGSLRVWDRGARNMSTDQHNARHNGRTNGTNTYMNDVLTPEDLKYAMAEARQRDARGLERKRRREIVDEDRAVVDAKTRKDEAAASKLRNKRLKLVQLDPIVNPMDSRLPTLTVKQLDEHLEWHREFYDTGPKGDKKIPMKSLLKVKKSKIEALVEAATRYHAEPLSELPTMESVAATDAELGTGMRQPAPVFLSIPIGAGTVQEPGERSVEGDVFAEEDEEDMWEWS